MKRFSILCAALTCGVLGYLAPPAAVADEQDKKTVITISAPTEVPGIVLEPGTYVIKLLNSSSNRHIAEIMNERMDHLYALTFTAAAERLQPTSKPVLTFYEETPGRPQALRRWFWPGDTIGQEFLYPKNQALRISAATKTTVPEGNLPTVAESGQKLTPDNAQGLSFEEKTEISQAPPPAPVATESTVTESTVIAQNTPQHVDRDDVDKTPKVDTDDKPKVDLDDQPKVETSAQVAPAPEITTVASASNETTDRELPKTAGQLPLLLGIGILSLLAAFALGLVRRHSTSTL